MNILTKLVAYALFFVCSSCEERVGKGKHTSQNKSDVIKSNFTSEKLSEELSKITYPEMTIDDVNFEQAIAFVIQMGAERHPNAPFIIPFKLSPNISNEMKFTIKCKDLTFNEIMNRICAETGLTWKIDDGMVVVNEGK